MVLYISKDPKSKKYLILLLSLLISYLFISFLYYSSKFNNIFYLFQIFQSLGKVLAVIPFYFIKKSSKKKFKEDLKIDIIEKFSKNDIYFFISILVMRFFEILYIQFNKDGIGDNFDYLQQSLMLLLISFILRYQKKTDFHIHQIYSHLMFTIFALIIDLRLYFVNKPSFKFLSLVLDFFCIVYYCIYYSYHKYLMEYKYISVYIICSFFGLIDVIIYIIIIFLSIKYGYTATFDDKEVTIRNYFRKLSLIDLIGSSIFTIFYSIFNLIFYLIIDNFTVAHALVTYIIIDSGEYSVYYISKMNTYEYLIFSICLSALLIFNMFIYLEIIELDFWGLNKNTRRNILIREEKEKKKLSIICLNNNNNEEEEEESEESEESEDNVKEKLEVPGGYLVELQRK